MLIYLSVPCWHQSGVARGGAGDADLQHGARLHRALRGHRGLLRRGAFNGLGSIYEVVADASYVGLSMNRRVPLPVGGLICEGACAASWETIYDEACPISRESIYEQACTVTWGA
jgi:hypothetical protein